MPTSRLLARDFGNQPLKKRSWGSEMWVSPFHVDRCVGVYTYIHIHMYMHIYIHIHVYIFIYAGGSMGITGKLFAFILHLRA